MDTKALLDMSEDVFQAQSRRLDRALNFHNTGQVWESTKAAHALLQVRSARLTASIKYSLTSTMIQDSNLHAFFRIYSLILLAWALHYWNDSEACRQEAEKWWCSSRLSNLESEFDEFFSQLREALDDVAEHQKGDRPRYQYALEDFDDAEAVADMANAQGNIVSEEIADLEWLLGSDLDEWKMIGNEEDGEEQAADEETEATDVEMEGVGSEPRAFALPLRLKDRKSFAAPKRQ